MVFEDNISAYSRDKQVYNDKQVDLDDKPVDV